MLCPEGLLRKYVAARLTRSYAPPVTAGSLKPAHLEEKIRGFLKGKDMSALTLSAIRQHLEESLELPMAAFEEHVLKGVVTKVLNTLRCESAEELAVLSASLITSGLVTAFNRLHSVHDSELIEWVPLLRVCMLDIPCMHSCVHYIRPAANLMSANPRTPCREAWTMRAEKWRALGHCLPRDIDRSIPGSPHSFLRMDSS